MNARKKLEEHAQNVIDAKRQLRDAQGAQSQAIERADELAELLIDAEERGDLSIDGMDGKTPEVKKLLVEAGVARARAEDVGYWRKRIGRGGGLLDARIELREMLFSMLCALTAYTLYSSFRRQLSGRDVG